MAKESVVIPDLGNADDVDVIELSVKPGDVVVVDQSLIVLESAKATMEVPSSVAGTVLALTVKVGDKVRSGTVIAEIETAAVSAAAEKNLPPQKAEPAPVAALSPKIEKVTATAANNASPPANETAQSLSAAKTDAVIYAGPAVRQLARELGVELRDVQASGPRGRMTQDDVRRYVKHLVGKMATVGSAVQGSGIPPIPAVDFSKFGSIELLPMTRIDKITRDNMHRSWVNLPHVTQWDEADVTDLEEFRADMKADMEKRKIKLTPMAFLLKAAANALREYPKFNRSLHEDGEHFVQKSYVHIGIAVDTPMGLMVPVIRDVDKKGLWDLGAEVAQLSDKARNGKLMPADMQGGCFTISSLGTIGGNGFTPIINAPEVAILGVSKTQMKPVWSGKDFA
ncbi:MAG TPA: 2-oxo acid dehydrogenase subunit E2, partial [Pseudomonadales bacterium]|nr:2-oxo acid dehydrogenase subunit E2 [Pseudomonadales bacterium]